VEGLTRALAVELAPIRVNAVSPGLSQTPRWNALSDAARQALYEHEEKRLPLGRLGTAVEIASAYIYFMKNTYATGNVLSVDGGGALV
jgi:NAD(P)-dependent dehydrogenase (short-subunit alcohol dehydrogenase family)